MTKRAISVISTHLRHPSLINNTQRPTDKVGSGRLCVVRYLIERNTTLQRGTVEYTCHARESKLNTFSFQRLYIHILTKLGRKGDTVRDKRK